MRTEGPGAYVRTPNRSTGELVEVPVRVLGEQAGPRADGRAGGPAD